MIPSYLLIFLLALAVRSNPLYDDKYMIEWTNVMTYEPYLYNLITTYPHRLTVLKTGYNVHKYVFNEFGWRLRDDLKLFKAKMDKGRIVSWYNHLGRLQENFQTNSVSFTLTSLRILRQLLKILPSESSPLNLAPTIFEMIKRPHKSIDVIDSALTLYLGLTEVAHNLDADPLLNEEDIQLLLDRLKGSEYTIYMKAKVFGILRYESRGCLEELKKEQNFLYTHVLETTKALYESAHKEKYEIVDKLLNSWAHIVTSMNGIPSTLMESYVSKINDFAKAGIPWEDIKYLLDFTGEPDVSNPNSLCSHNDLLLLMQDLKELDKIMELISIFNMDKNQLQEKHALPFLELMKSENKAVVLKAKDILLNNFPGIFHIGGKSDAAKSFSSYLENDEVDRFIFEAVINVLKATNWDLDISLRGLRIIQNESTSDVQMGEELMSLMQSLETLEDERKLEIMALGMQILRASFNTIRHGITYDQSQFISRTVAAAESLEISIILKKYREIAGESSASSDKDSEASIIVEEGQEKASKETEGRLNMLTRFREIIVIKGKEILQELIKAITSTEAATFTQTPVVTSATSLSSVVTSATPLSSVVTTVLEKTNDDQPNLAIAVGVPLGIVAFLATSFVLVRCRKNINSIVDNRLWLAR